MPQIINTNIASLNAQRNLNASQRDQDVALQRLSSGLRINSAKDDAAGLAISTRFDAQVRGTSVAVRNSGDAISLAQTAEGALDSINTSLQRVRELALQSANDTNTSIDRQALQEEVDQLISEIQNVAESANFNGKKLLDGSFQNSVFQTGANVGDTVKVSIAKVDADSLGSAATAGISSAVDKTALIAGTDDLDLVAGDVVVNGFAVGASSGSDDGSSRILQSSSAIAKAAAINAVSDQTGVSASAAPNVVEGTAMATVAAEAATAITINGEAFNLTTAVTANLSETRVELQKVADVINGKAQATGVTAVLAETTAGYRVDLVAADGRNIDIVDGANDSFDFGLATGGVAAATAAVYAGDVTLTSNDGSDIVITSNTANIDNSGFEEGTFSGVNAGAVGNAGTDAVRNTLVAGDLLVNGVDVGVTLATDDTASTAGESESAIALAAAINRVSDETGVTAEANQNTIYSGDITVTGDGALTVNGTAVTIGAGTDVATKVANAIEAINDVSGQTGVRAEILDANSYKLIAEDGRNIEIGGTGALNDEGFGDDVYVAGVKLSAAGEFELGTKTGGIEGSGFQVGTYGGSESGTKLSDIDITTSKGAEAAIIAIDNAVDSVASSRAELGAIQNRFESTIANLEISRENLSAANSRILDADFAQETAALSKSQVLQQAGISVLAQANARPQQVLSLLQ